MEELKKLVEVLEKKREKVNEEMQEASKQHKMDDYRFLFGVLNGYDGAILQANLMIEGLA
jgi:hypothetical protein